MDSTPQLPIEQFLSMHYVHGRVVTVGLPDNDEPLPTLHAFDLVPNGCYMEGSAVGCKKECMEMLKLAAEKDIKPWNEELPITDAKKALERMGATK